MMKAVNIMLLNIPNWLKNVVFLMHFNKLYKIIQIFGGIVYWV